MKKIYTLLALALVSGSVMAQSKDGVKFGVRAGVNFASVALSGKDVDKEDKDGLKSLTSFNFGGYAEIPISEKFSIQPGLSLSGKGYKTESSDTDDGITFTDKVTNNLMYLEIPINAVFNFNGFYFGAGPYLSYAISGKSKYKGTVTGEPDENKEEDIKIGNNKDEDQIKPLDFGVNAMAGYKLPNGLNFGLNYGLGLSNLDVDSSKDYKMSNRVFSVLVGFSF